MCYYLQRKIKNLFHIFIFLLERDDLATCVVVKFCAGKLVPESCNFLIKIIYTLSYKKYVKNTIHHINKQGLIKLRYCKIFVFF